MSKRGLIVLLAIQNLLPAGQLQAMPTDGSTLAADRTSGTATISSAADAVSPFTGAATDEIAIKLPQGTGGLTPSLTLRYSSQSGLTSWVGLGWSLGTFSISRSLKRGTPVYDDALDTFALDGEELVLESCTTSGADEQCVYRARRENFLKIVHDRPDGAASSWTVHRPDGTKLLFGIDDASRIGRSAVDT